MGPQLFVAGEHCDYDTRMWAQKVFKSPVLDNWWQVTTDPGDHVNHHDDPREDREDDVHVDDEDRYHADHHAPVLDNWWC